MNTVEWLTSVSQCGKKLDESCHPVAQTTVSFHSKIVQKQQNALPDCRKQIQEYISDPIRTVFYIIFERNSNTFFSPVQTGNTGISFLSSGV